METSGLEPEITICKIIVLPFKPCPPIILYGFLTIIFYYISI